MDYEKKYKEALEMAKDYYKANQKLGESDENEVLSDIFPELRESEDERIREEIISIVKSYRESYIPEGNYRFEDCIAWLEKQKESELSEDLGKYIAELSKQFPEVSFAKLSRIAVRVKNWLEKQGKETNWKPSKEEMDVLYGLAYITNQYDERKEEVITRLYQDLKREFFNGASYENMFPTHSIQDDVRRRSTIQVLEYARSLDNYNQYGKADIDKNIAWLEKQGNKDKFIKEEIECIKGYRENAIKKLEELEKQGEQKKSYDVCDSSMMDNKKSPYGEKRDFGYFEEKPADKIEPKFHEGEWIVWQNKCYKVNYNGCGYGLIDQNGLSTSLEYGTIDESAHLWTIQDAKDGDVLVFKNNIGGIIICKSPSDYDTRSYCRLIRDNLINKEESGWDSTLLVPATKEQRDTLLKAMADAGYTFDFDKKELKKIEKKPQRMVSAESKEALYDKPTDEEMKELLRTEYEKGRADTLSEMKSSWSEEDEVRLQACLDTLQAKSLMGKVDTTITMWLKSLKDRYTWRPSNEQIDTLEHFVRSIGESGYASPYDNNTKLLYSLLEQLKKLKA